MIYPSKLEKNDIIEIISPSNGVSLNKIEKYENAVAKLISYGFKVIEDKYVRNSVNGVSSNAQNRARELNYAITNKEVKALIACSGGDYLFQILDLIEFEKITDNVKWIQGQSDITSLLLYITTKYDLATIYSFNVKKYGDDGLPELMIKNNIDLFKEKIPIQKEYGFMLEGEQTNQPWKCITKDTDVEGRIIGGCLESLKDLIGTKYDNVKEFINKYKKDGIVWYFDVFNMSNENIVSTLWQFKSAGWFDGCSGILFGRIANEVTYTNLTLEDAIKYNLEGLNIPILIDTDIGHTNPVLTIVNGSKVKIFKTENNSKYVIQTSFE